LLSDTNRHTEAEPMMRRALAIDEKSFGLEHPNVARDLNNLALLMQATDRLAEAEMLYRRALAIFEKSYGPDHPNGAVALNTLAVSRAEGGDWAEAAALGQRAKQMLIGRQGDGSKDRAGIARAALASNALALRAHARAAYRAKVDNADSLEEGFELAQWALQSGAADALAQMSVRFAKGAGPLAPLVRERQDLLSRRQGEMRRLDTAVGTATAKAADDARTAVAELDGQLDAIDARLATEFKAYAELANPKPLTIASTQALLRSDEALVVFLDVPQFGKLPEESLAWLVTKETVRWRSIPLGTRALSDRVAALRCGLDRAAWDGEWASRCSNLIGIDVNNKTPKDTEPLPFDVARAHELYLALFGPIEDQIKGKHLLIVPSGPLTYLPFNVLVTAPPKVAIPTSLSGYRDVAWLGTRQPITVLPAVTSLQALRQRAKTSQAAKPYIAFGNPLLDGPDMQYAVRAELARSRQHCPKAPLPRTARLASLGMNAPNERRGDLMDVAEIREQVPLPETADELCAVARSLGVPASDIWLGARASEAEVKKLSDSGELSAYRILHFATHGALSGELKPGSEPGLILTPPREATSEDDGYLSASEIAGLKLDADWVILSACSTAAGGAEGAEALSGLARAFFYAGARSLLVSHWSVDSNATVKLITETLRTMADEKSIGRSEALRRSMLALIEKGAPQEAHPAYWAAFFVVGEGGPQLTVLTTSSVVSGPQSPTKPQRRPLKKLAPADWRKEVWRQ
jgi:CHAT domain-containing protein